METYAYHGCHERIMLLSVYVQTVKSVIIQDAVVDAFRGSPLLIYFFVSIRAAWDVGIKPDIPFRFGFNDSSVF